MNKETNEIFFNTIPDQISLSSLIKWIQEVSSNGNSKNLCEKRTKVWYKRINKILYITTLYNLKNPTNMIDSYQKRIITN